MFTFAFEIGTTFIISSATPCRHGDEGGYRRAAQRYAVS